MSLIQDLKSVFHKKGVNPDDWERVHPNLLLLAEYVLHHCHDHNLPMVITSIIRPKIKGVSISATHEQGRAFDLSIRGWSHEDVEFLVGRINRDFQIGAVSIKDGKEREAVYEDGITKGTGAHIHFQVRK